MRPETQRRAVATAERPAPPPGSRTVRLAAALAIYALILAYLIGLAVTLIAGTRTWPAALAYPLALLTPSPWPAAVAAGVLVLALAACTAIARHLAAPALSPVSPPSPPGAPPPPASPPAPASAEEAPTAQSSPSFIPHVFISHSSADNEFGKLVARRLAEALGGEGDVFYDALGDGWAEQAGTGLVGGDDWPRRLQHEITERNVFVLILSPEAVASGWVEHELYLALRQVASPAGKVLIPVLHRETTIWPFLTRYQIVRFIPRHPTDPPVPFDQAFAELLAAVRLGRSRKVELEELREVRIGPPYDVDLLPLPEHFVGRAEEIEWALERLAPAVADAPPPTAQATGLASITAVNGLAGIGKSALASQIVRVLYATNSFPDGIAVVLCNGLTDPAEVLRRVLARFDEQGRMPEESDFEALRRRVRAYFARLTALVVLDNLESGLPVEQVITALRAANVAVLATSRGTIPNLPPGTTRQLDVLPEDQARDLFAVYYRAVAGAADLAPFEQALAARIVDELGRHTLAVKLAGAYARRRNLAEVARELANPSRALDLEIPDSPEGVKRVFETSYLALDEPAQRLFAALGAFAGPDLGRRAALALAGGIGLEQGERALDLLIFRALADDQTNAEMPAGSDRERLRLHPLTFAYAGQLFARLPAGDRDAAQRALAAFYAEYANEAPDPALGPDEPHIVRALEWAHEHSEDALVAGICYGMDRYWRDRSRVRTSLDYLPWGIAAARALNQSMLLGYLLRDYGAALQVRGDIQGAERAYTESLSTFREAGDDLGTARLQEMLGRLEMLRGRPDQAEAYYQQAREMFERAGRDEDLAVLLSSIGDVQMRRGDLAGAQANYERYLAIMRAVGDTRGEGVALAKLGQLAQARGRLEEAERYLQQSLVIRREVQDRQGEGVVLFSLARIPVLQRRKVISTAPRRCIARV